MTKETLDPEVRDALWDLQRYLSDQVAPMMVTDSIETLLHCSPEIAAGEIHGWLAHRRSGPASAPVWDCLLQAMKKLHEMTEFNLIEQEHLERYLSALGEIVIGFCPEQEKKLLRENLERLGQELDDAATAGADADAGRIAPAGIARTTVERGDSPRPAGAGDSPAATSAADLDRGMKRLALVLKRIGDPARPESTEQALRLAALNARDGAEFETYLERLREEGLDVDAAQVFRALASGLPGWDLPAGVTPPPGHAVEAMYRLVSNAGTPTEGAHRFAEMVQAAIDRFNEKQFVQAQTIFELANRIIEERKLQPEVVESIKLNRCPAVADRILRELSRQPGRFPVLRTVLDFFPPFSVRELLNVLQGESRPEYGQLQLALLEAHGEPARAGVLDRLAELADEPPAGPPSAFRRNLVALLGRIARSDRAEEEVELLVRCSALDQPPGVVHEALAALATWKHVRAERTLIERLEQIETMLAGETETSLSAEQLETLLDRVITALCTFGTPRALRSVVAHGLDRRGSAPGDPVARLAALGSHDMSVDAKLVERLVRELRRRLPSRVLGFRMRREASDGIGLVRALAATPGPAVRKVMQEIIQRFPDRDIGAEAAAVLKGLAAAEISADPGRPDLSGDVESFGLPSLLQKLCDLQLAGTLHLADAGGETFATLQLEDRKLVACATGSLSGTTAFYRLFEKPAPGTFTFTRGACTPGGDEPIDVSSAIFCALRRHDAFSAARAVVPDDASFAAGSVTPTPCDDEEDLAFMRSVWVKASSGTTPAKCEAAIASDAYRIRRLYAHWVEIGALRPA